MKVRKGMPYDRTERGVAGQRRQDYCEKRLLEMSATSQCSISSIANMPLDNDGSAFFYYLISGARRYIGREGELEVSWEAAKAWEDCGIALAQRELLVRKLLAVIDERAAVCRASGLLLVDLGAGTGRVVLDTCGALQKRGTIKRISASLVERSKEACDLARHRGVLQRNVVIEVIQADMRELDWDNIRPCSDDLVVVLASQSMHEIPWNDKTFLLRAINRKGWDVVIAELEGDHDRTASCRQSLISSVCNFYGQLVDSVICGEGHSGSKESAVLVVEGFLIPEALRLLTENRERRGNYHLKRDGWERLLRGSGFNVKCLHYGDVDGCGPPLWIGAGLME